jgi:hypothetical protein
MPLRDHLGHFIRAPEAETAPAEALAAEGEPLSPVEALHQAQCAWREHQQQLDGLRDQITATAEARRAALIAEDWPGVAAIDERLSELRIRLEGGEMRSRVLGEAVTAAEEGIGRAEQETLRPQLARALEEMCADAHRLVASIEKVRVLQCRAGEQNPLPEALYVNGWMITRWAEYHDRKTYTEAA